MRSNDIRSKISFILILLPTVITFAAWVVFCIALLSLSVNFANSFNNVYVGVFFLIISVILSSVFAIYMIRYFFKFSRFIIAKTNKLILSKYEYNELYKKLYGKYQYEEDQNEK